MGRTTMGNMMCGTDEPTSAIVAAGFGKSAEVDVEAAVVAAVKDANVSEATIAFCACTIDAKPEDVQAEFAKALPGVPIHGLTSNGNLLTASGAAKGVGCLLIKANAGAFATSFSETGDAAAAVAALKEKMAAPQAIFMSTTPGK